MRPPILDRLTEGQILIGDGATGTYLQMSGLEPGGCPEELNLSQPELVQEMASAYFKAGSDIVLTNSFGGTKFMLGKYGYADRVTEFNYLAAQHASSQTPNGKYTLGSVGPTGEFLEPIGEVTTSEMLDAFIEQVTALEEGGAHDILVETMSAIEETILAIRAVKEKTTIPVLASMTFAAGPRGCFTMMGITPREAAIELRKAGADVVGSNCGNGIEAMTEIAYQMRQATDAPMIINSNAGIPSILKGLIVYPETPEIMADYIPKLRKLGINIIGGCCGTTPNHIKKFSDSIMTPSENKDLQKKGATAHEQS